MSTESMPDNSKASSRAADPTLCDPDVQQAIESHYGFRLDQADQEQIKLLVSNSKKAGNECFKERRYRGELAFEASLVCLTSLQRPLPSVEDVRAEAVSWYSQAIAGDPQDQNLFSNRSAAHLALDEPEEALQDARKALHLKAAWPKAHYRCASLPCDTDHKDLTDPTCSSTCITCLCFCRLGAAHLALFQWQQAAEAFAHGLELSPQNADMVGLHELMRAGKA